MTISSLTRWCLAVYVLIATQAFAHHSQSFFDRKTDITIEGVITRYELINPHTWLYVDATNEAGEVVHWVIEANAAVTLRRLGWRPNSLKAGDKVTITMWPLKDGRPGGLLHEVVLANGDVLTQE